ncbi:phospho-sugar mutase [Mycolicibacillus trivialis]|uniref:Phosphomannomutase n=1 Tax=Mycolicibacillus trivialis TaxID=1798 RepID=A0A1X2EKN8_9MYCO|nr:phospho-sugar mutase [Mycolicibacillus trivialis]ORX05501.1 phosphomannomutase [Mycolicibacillus trivialis]
MTPEEWIAHDPDPVTAAELAACDRAELAARFARPLTFGTAGLRGPVRGGPDAMNSAVVLRASWAVGQVLTARGACGPVVVGRDARHGSQRFAVAAAEVLAAQGFSVVSFPEPVPTPVLAYAARSLEAACGIQITASHNPATDNGYKVYFDGGIQIVPPADAQIEAAMATAPPADEIARSAAAVASPELIERYLARAASVRRATGAVRVALTALHGVGGAVVLEALRRAGVDDVHVVDAQFAPDPDFPTVAFPNPEEPGAADALLELAAAVGADVAIALDPDADRCAVGIPDGDRWRMLSGDETGWLLGDYVLSTLDPGRTAQPIVASTVVSSRMLSAIAADHGARHVETLTGFKWLARADTESPDAALVYAYEEAIGHCVDPDAVRDKDGISAAVLVCDLVAALRGRGSSVTGALDALARRHGVHVGAAVTRRVSDTAEATVLMGRLRAQPPARLGGFDATASDLAERRDAWRSDALVYTGGDDERWARVVVRPSGTEPKLKCYIEVRCAVDGDLGAARGRAQRLCDEVVAQVEGW